MLSSSAVKMKILLTFHWEPQSKIILHHLDEYRKLRPELTGLLQLGWGPRRLDQRLPARGPRHVALSLLHLSGGSHCDMASPTDCICSQSARPTKL